MIPIHDTAHGASFAVKVHPRAKQNAITGELGTALKLALTAPPVSGKANEACIEFFANLLKVPGSSVTIASGLTSRSKVVRVAGLSGEEVRQLLKIDFPGNERLSFSQRLQEIRTGFERPFWVANITEIFERLSYYAVFAVLARYLHEALLFPSDQAARLSGFFGASVWVMAVFGGAVADRIGFRRALSLAYFILTCSYFLVGSIAAPWLAPIRNLMPLGVMAGIILFLPALGVALVKPSVVGTTAGASKENVRSIGYSIYYTLVNIGSFWDRFWQAGYTRGCMWRTYFV